jgi:hypothetical protein
VAARTRPSKSHEILCFDAENILQNLSILLFLRLLRGTEQPPRGQARACSGRRTPGARRDGPPGGGRARGLGAATPARRRTSLPEAEARPSASARDMLLLMLRSRPVAAHAAAHSVVSARARAPAWASAVARDGAARRSILLGHPLTRGPRGSSLCLCDANTTQLASFRSSHALARADRLARRCDWPAARGACVFSGGNEFSLPFLFPLARALLLVLLLLLPRAAG